MIRDPALPCELLGELPPFRRAREYRLYDVRGRRYLDLWQVWGHAVHGHRGARGGTCLKNVISRGLVSDLPSLSSGRLERRLRSLFPDHPHVRIYSSLERALEAASRIMDRAIAARDVLDPAWAPEVEGTGGHRRSLHDAQVVAWRPLSEVPVPEDARIILPVLPFTMGGCPWAVCSRSAVEGASDVLSPLVLEGTLRALDGLEKLSWGPMASRLQREHPRRWNLRGIYLAPRFDPERYSEVFRTFLSQGVVLSPCYECPSVLPRSVSDGEARKLVGLFRAFPAE